MKKFTYDAKMFIVGISHYRDYTDDHIEQVITVYTKNMDLIVFDDNIPFSFTCCLVFANVCNKIGHIVGDLEVYINNLYQFIDNIKPKSSEGYIMVGNRIEDQKLPYFFIELTGRTPQERLKDYDRTNRQCHFTFYVKDHVITEKVLHLAFDKIRTKRSSETKDGNEIEWFVFENQIDLQVVKQVCEQLITITDVLCVNKKEHIKKTNLNIANQEELADISHIGRRRSNAIMEYRKNNGTFDKIEDIMKVKGIKHGIFSKIKDFVCV